jgi:hypothetical protein
MEERKGSGCVRLSDFYGSSVHDEKWQFTEKTDYLRSLGALDESDPEIPRVLVPNYLGGASNCLASSKYYSVCCLNECEALMDHLEIKLGAPDATPASITAIISALPSASVPANRTLPEYLIKRLSSIAQHHSGRVPLHGRLFAQWMHHAYPRECAYPHMSGTTAPVKVTALEDQGIDIVEPKSEMQVYMEASAKRMVFVQSDSVDVGSCMAWHQEEELFMPWQPPTLEPLENDPHLWTGFRFISMVSILMSVVLLLRHSTWKALRLCRPAAVPTKTILFV